MSGSTELLIVILAVSAFYLLLRRARHREVATVDPDTLVLYRLLQAGSDLKKLHSPEFFLYFSSETAAQAAAGRLTEEGYKTEVKSSPGSGDSWLCQATKGLILHPGTLIVIRRQMNALAQELGGTYDGWGCPVVK